jgi:hypothetical protein
MKDKKAKKRSTSRDAEVIKDEVFIGKAKHKSSSKDKKRKRERVNDIELEDFASKSP